MKICTKCKIEKDETAFSKRSLSKDGLRTQCKICVNIYNKENKDMIREQKKKYREEHKEERKEYREKNKEKIKEKQKEYRKNNREKLNEISVK